MHLNADCEKNNNEQRGYTMGDFITYFNNNHDCFNDEIISDIH